MMTSIMKTLNIRKVCCTTSVHTPSLSIEEHMVPINRTTQQQYNRINPHVTE